MKTLINTLIYTLLFSTAAFASPTECRVAEYLRGVWVTDNTLSNNLEIQIYQNVTNNNYLMEASEWKKEKLWSEPKKSTFISNLVLDFQDYYSHPDAENNPNRFEFTCYSDTIEIRRYINSRYYSKTQISYRSGNEPHIFYSVHIYDDLGNEDYFIEKLQKKPYIKR